MSNISVNDRAAVRVITSERPERRNAVDFATAAELAGAFAEFDTDEGLSVAVLTGAGGHFCAGADLKALAGDDAGDLSMDAHGPMGPTRLRLGKPVIAAVEGYAVAGGLELALWCDLRVAARDAVFGVFCRRFGVPLIDGGTVRLPRLVGQSRAMDMILTGRGVSAAEALDFGLANRVSDPGRALEDAVSLALELSLLPQACMRNDRQSLLAQWGMGEEEAMADELRLGLLTIASGETAAGAHAFSAGQGRHGEACS
jgi:enoyl-CoA hydratase